MNAPLHTRKFPNAASLSNLRHALRSPHSDKGWAVDRTPYGDVCKRLNVNLEGEISERLKRGKVVGLELGTGGEPEVLKWLAKRFRNEIASGQLELHGTHLTRKAEWEGFLKSQAGLPVTFHRATVPRLIGDKVKADIIWDHFGPTYQEMYSVVAPISEHVLKPNGVYAFHWRTKNRQLEDSDEHLRELGAKEANRFMAWDGEIVDNERIPGSHISFHIRK